MDFLKALWRGEVALGKTYWLYGAVGSLLLFGIPGIIFGVSGLYERTDPVALFTLVIYGFVLAPAYTIFISVAIWRSSNNYHGNQLLAVLAKVAVVFGILSWINEFI